ncbi:MAG: hypothetical protein M3O70_21670 [Actinomycetota bacterium]|nr:hypothetical protein [Actinomycetota bacterium]
MDSVHQPRPTALSFPQLPPFGPRRVAWLTSLEQVIEDDVHCRLLRERESGGGDDLVGEVLHGVRRDLHLRIDFAVDRAQALDEIDQLEAGAA